MAILTCKQTCECISLQIFSKYPIQKSWDRTNPPLPPNFESLPYPRCRWQVRNFFAKMKGKDELEGTRSNFTPWLCDFEHQGDNRQGGLVQPPLRRTRVKKHIILLSKCTSRLANKRIHIKLVSSVINQHILSKMRLIDRY